MVFVLAFQAITITHTLRSLGPIPFIICVLNPEYYFVVVKSVEGDMIEKEYERERGKLRSRCVTIKICLLKSIWQGDVFGERRNTSH